LGGFSVNKTVDIHPSKFKKMDCDLAFPSNPIILKDAPPASTPTLVLHSKKLKKKKKLQARVNWSTPTGTSNGITVDNHGFEAIPVSDYKEEYPTGDEPKNPGGSNLRHLRCARFKLLQFWKDKKLIYKVQNEKGLLGKALGDIPVVSGVMHALSTSYKEKKKREFPKKKRTSEEGKSYRRSVWTCCAMCASN